MKAIDRVMRAYLSTRRLTDDETSLLRAELSKFIDDLMLDKATQESPTSSERMR